MPRKLSLSFQQKHTIAHKNILERTQSEESYKMISRQINKSNASKISKIKSPEEKEEARSPFCRSISLPAKPKVSLSSRELRWGFAQSDDEDSDRSESQYYYSSESDISQMEDKIEVRLHLPVSASYCAETPIISENSVNFDPLSSSYPIISASFQLPGSNSLPRSTSEPVTHLSSDQSKIEVEKTSPTITESEFINPAYNAVPSNKTTCSAKSMIPQSIFSKTVVLSLEKDSKEVPVKSCCIIS